MKVERQRSTPQKDRRSKDDVFEGNLEKSGIWISCVQNRSKGCPLDTPYQPCDPKTHWALLGGSWYIYIYYIYMVSKLAYIEPFSSTTMYVKICHTWSVEIIIPWAESRTTVVLLRIFQYKTRSAISLMVELKARVPLTGCGDGDVLLFPRTQNPY